MTTETYMILIELSEGHLFCDNSYFFFYTQETSNF